MLAGEFRKEQLYISDANIVDSLRGGTSLSHSGISPAEVKACRARHKTHAAKTHRRADKNCPCEGSQVLCTQHAIAVKPNILRR